MNYLQFLAFFIFAFSLLVTGLWVFGLVNPKDKLVDNKSLLAGEAFLLGGIVYVGIAVLLSLIFLYKASFLWATVGLGYLSLLNKDVRKHVKEIALKAVSFDLSHVVFILLMLMFFLRNCYFLVDVDSHAVYLYVQKLWLEHGTSVFASRALDHQTFIPHFDFVPTALGISLWGRDSLLFCQLINFFWRFVAVLLVYGYMRYRFNGVYALAASMLVVFNDHFFTSGANQWVLINGAVIAFLFAFAYNLWESKKEQSSERLLLALVFFSQIITNKIGLIFVFILLFIWITIFIEWPVRRFKQMLKQKNLCLVFWGIFVLSSLWFLKNLLATGIPTFPILAWKTGAVGWTPEMANTIQAVFRGTPPMQFLKYANYLLIWPGVHPLKIVSLAITFLPLIVMFSILKGGFDKQRLLEFCYWILLSFLIIFGTCLASHQDPRYFRYPIALCAVASIFTVDYIIRNCFKIRSNIFIGIVLLLIALPGYRILIHNGGGEFRRASIGDNLKVLTNQMHFNDVIEKHYPQNVMAQKDIDANPDKFLKAAWLIGNQTRTPSAFLAPTRPQVGLWVSTVINWNSYDDPVTIVKDLQDAQIKYVMVNKGDRLAFLTDEEFAQEAIQFERYPEIIFYPYDRPLELIQTKYKKEK